MNLLISFPDQSTSFTNGVEYGRLLQKMEQGDEIISNNGFPVHVENRELITSTCKQYGYTPLWGELSYGWIEFKAIKQINKN